MFFLPPRSMDLIIKPRADAVAKESVRSSVAESGEDILGSSASRLNKDECPSKGERAAGATPVRRESFFCSN